MTLGSTKLARKRIRADEADPSAVLANTVAGATASATVDGFTLEATGAGASGHYHYGDKLFFDLDRLVSVEFLFRASGLSNNGQIIELGMISDYNADLSLVPQRVLLRSQAAQVKADEYRFEASSDDGVIDTPAIDTGINLINNKWMRAQLGFKERVQTQVWPATSKPGKSSVQWAISDATASVNKAFNRKTHQPTAHLDLSNYVGGLQPVIGIGGNAAPGAKLDIVEILIQYEQVT